MQPWLLPPLAPGRLAACRHCGERIAELVAVGVHSRPPAIPSWVSSLTTGSIRDTGARTGHAPYEHLPVGKLFVSWDGSRRQSFAVHLHNPLPSFSGRWGKSWLGFGPVVDAWAVREWRAGNSFVPGFRIPPKRTSQLAWPPMGGERHIGLSFAQSVAETGFR